MVFSPHVVIPPYWNSFACYICFQKENHKHKCSACWHESFRFLHVINVYSWLKDVRPSRKFANSETVKDNGAECECLMGFMFQGFRFTLFVFLKSLQMSIKCDNISLRSAPVFLFS